MKLYRGVVEENVDPEKIGRVKVRIYGLHTENVTGFNSVLTKDLPWAQVMGGNQFGLIGGVGISSVLRQGTWVWVILEEENPNKPIVIGTVLGKNNNPSGDSFVDPDGNHPSRTDRSDLHPLLDDKYPTIATLETESGHLIELDDTSGDERIKVTHRTGTYVQIDKDGNMNVNVVGNLQYDVAGTTTINSGGNYTVVAPRIDLNP